MPQTSIYVFRVKEKHPDNFKVRFIDFSNDGYKRSGRKKAKASKKLKDGGQAEARYEEVVNLVMNGASDLRLLTHDEFKEDAIALSGDRYGRDWNFTQHRHKYGSSSHADTYDIVESYQEWQVSNMSKNDVNIEDYTDTLERMRESFSLKGGKWEKKAVKEMFNVGNTVGVQNGGGVFLINLHPLSLILLKTTVLHVTNWLNLPKKQASLLTLIPLQPMLSSINRNRLSVSRMLRK